MRIDLNSEKEVFLGLLVLENLLVNLGPDYVDVIVGLDADCLSDVLQSLL